MHRENVITGNEDPIDPREPEGALAEFYRAFNSRDLALMERTWDGSEEASMDNPLGGICRGWNAIRSVYERIFTGSTRVQVEFHDFSLHRLGDGLLAVGRERGRAEAHGSVVALAIRTSRFFALREGRWRQFHHHGSIEDATLLTAYKALVATGEIPAPQRP